MELDAVPPRCRSVLGLMLDGVGGFTGSPVYLMSSFLSPSIKSVRRADAGEYRCRLSVSNKVIESNPIIVEVEGECPSRSDAALPDPVFQSCVFQRVRLFHYRSANFHQRAE